jgi:hypothetical protein
MGIFKKLSSLFQPPTSDRNFWFYVQCDHCQEILKGRVDMHNHLSIQYGEGNSANTYYCRKVMIGSKRCYKPIEVEFTFDSNRKLLDKQIKGGKFVTEDEYQDAQAAGEI